MRYSREGEFVPFQRPSEIPAFRVHFQNSNGPSLTAKRSTGYTNSCSPHNGDFFRAVARRTVIEVDSPVNDAFTKSNKDL